MEKTATPDPTWSYEWFEAAQAAMEAAWCNGDEGTHGWHRVQVAKNPLHPVIHTILQTYRPVNWQDLLMQWPYVSETDPMRLAYTPSEEYGAANRQVITSIGKYVHKHWPHVKDNVLRDAASLYTPDTFKIVETIQEIILGCENGPRSCMTSRSSYCGHKFRIVVDGTGPPDWTLHPYYCYDPALGWRMALRVAKDGTIMARAMLNEKVFVRTYGRTENDPDLSTADTALCAWLEASGYEKESSWPTGTQLRCRDMDATIQAPYLDGNDTGLSYSSQGVYEIVDEGEYTANQTTGRAERSDDDDEHENDWTCDHCGEVQSEDEYATTVGVDEDEQVCEHCLRRHYTEVRGAYDRRPYYRDYFVLDNDAEEVRGQNYSIDTNNPPEDIVQLADGDWAESDDTVSVGDSYYMPDDPDLCRVEEDDDDGSNYALKDDCWQDHADKWHRDDVEKVNLDGEWYTADAAQEIVHERQEVLELEEVTA